jgi:hypothetical protein
MIHWEAEERRLDPRALAAGDATGWFEELYAAGASRARDHARGAGPNRTYCWQSGPRTHRSDGLGRRAIAVGCGLGADAEHVAGSASTRSHSMWRRPPWRWRKGRHPNLPVHYVAADLHSPPRVATGLWSRRRSHHRTSAPRPAAPPDDRQRGPARGVRRHVAGDRARHTPTRRPDRAAVATGREEVETFATDGLAVQHIEEMTVPGKSDQQRSSAELRFSELARAHGAQPGHLFRVLKVHVRGLHLEGCAGLRPCPRRPASSCR